MYLWRGLKPQSIVAAFNVLNERQAAQTDGDGGASPAPSTSQPAQANETAPVGRRDQTLGK